MGCPSSMLNRTILQKGIGESSIPVGQVLYRTFPLARLDPPKSKTISRMRRASSECLPKLTQNEKELGVNRFLPFRGDFH